VNRGRFSPGFIGQLHSQVLRRTLRTCRDNIAYNTLQYNFSRMLLLPLDELLMQTVVLVIGRPLILITFAAKFS
jgi:hypothetical protein